MDFEYRIASDRGSSFLATSPRGGERVVAAPPALARPAVGDYVSLDENDRITAIAPRRGVLARARSDRGNTPQIVAAHLDIVFIVTSPGRDFSPSRVERYVTAAHAGDIEPVIVLNKCDLAEDLESLLTALEAVAGGAAIHAMSATTGAGCDAIAAYLAASVTAAFVGSSGVGKSTLANYLIGTDLLATGAIRENDGRGKHTTTWREMIALPTGAWLIDTPGMRAFAPWADEAALAETFSDIEDAATRCRFRDCSHGAEPRCAVIAEIAGDRIARWRALNAEIGYLERRDDPELLAANRKKWRSLTKANRAKSRAESPR